jgi:hypothetical protein
MSTPSLETAIQNLFAKLEYINKSDTFVTKFDPEALKDRIGAIKGGNMLYNRNNAFLRKKQSPIGIDMKLINDDVNVVYDYALKYEIFAAPKSTTIEVKINADKFFV